MTTMQRKTQFALAAAAGVAVGLVAWAFAPRPLEVEAAKAAVAPFERSLEEDGRTRVVERYTVSAPLAGRLARITLREGDAVAAGDTLATITPALAPLLESADEGAAGVPALWLRCQHRLDHPEEALATFKRLEATRPLNAEAQGVASLLFLDEGEFADARRLSEAALRQRPDQLEALATRGTVFLADQDAAAALEWFGRALRVNPEDGRCWAGLAAARMLAMDFQGAREAFASAVQRIPGHQGTWIGYGWCLLLARDFLGAKAAFERAVEVDRNIAEAHGGLAVALARLGEVDAAKTEIEVANRLDKANLSSHYAQAVLSGLADDPERFKQFAARVLKGRPGIEGIAGGASLAELVMGRPGRSRPPARTPNPKA